MNSKETAKDITIMGAHGLGDAILSLKCSHFVEKSGYKVNRLVAVRDDIFRPLHFLYPEIEQVSEKYSSNNEIITNESLRREIIQDDSNFYYTIPDLLYRGPFSFDYKRFDTNPELIRATRTLTHLYCPNKLIAFCLATSTPGYLYKDIGSLIRKTAELLPEYTIYFPKITKWADTNITYGDLSNLPSNVWLSENPDFLESLTIMFTAEFAITTCNGPSHIFHELGTNKLTLDPQFGKYGWISRWKSNYLDCIDTDSDLISKLIETLVKIPQTTLIPRLDVARIVAQYPNPDWAAGLLFKF
jgi:hypothetical protein